MAGFELSEPLFAIINGLVEERIGMHYELRDAVLLGDKVATRAREAGFESALDYYYCLRYDDPARAEFDALVDVLLVNETYFFREIEPLRVVSDVLAEAVEAGRRPRVWCAACSTGEEPLTLAMLLASAGVLDGVEIVASDLSRTALARARSGVFGGRSLRAVAGEPLARWLTLGDREAVIAPEIHGAVRFERVNLMDAAAVDALGTFDVVICRNVLIYFRDATVVRVVDRLCGALREGGRILVGASESLLRFGTLLETEERRGAFLYRKPTR